MSRVDADLFAAHGLFAPLELEVETSGAEPQQTRYTLAQPWAVLGRDRSHRPFAWPRHEPAPRLSAGSRGQAIRGGPGQLTATGLTLDGASVRSCWLEPGQTLGLGGARVKWLTNHQQTPRFPSAGKCPGPSHGSDPLEDRVAGGPDDSNVCFEIVQGDKVVARWRMNRVLALVGTSALCRVRLNDDSVSRVHCSLVATEQGTWVIDLLSRKGVCVQGKKVPFALLRAEETVQIGEYQLRRRVGPFQADLRTAPAAVSGVLPQQTPRRTPGQEPVVVLDTGNDAVLMPLSISPDGQAAPNEHRLVVPLVQQFSACSSTCSTSSTRTSW